MSTPDGLQKLPSTGRPASLRCRCCSVCLPLRSLRRHFPFGMAAFLVSALASVFTTDASAYKYTREPRFESGESLATHSMLGSFVISLPILCDL